MAFAIRNLAVLAYANGFTLWHYKSGKDTLDGISGGNHLGDASDMLTAGDLIMVTAANTGAPGAATVQGTFPVYERLRAQVMTGTDPDGAHYADPVQYVAYFNGSDAVHYIARATYGSPQSVGCV